MSSYLVELSDAIVADLNAATFSLAFEAVRQYAPQYTIEELAALTVVVRPAKKKSELAARGLVGVTYTVEIGILSQVNRADENADVDPLAGLAEELEAHFLGNYVAERQEVCTGTDLLLIDPKSLTENTAFHSVVTLTLKGLTTR